MKKTPLEYAMNLIRMRDRSEGEIRQKMRLKGFFAEEIEETVGFLKERKFVDDLRFVDNYVASQCRQKISGRNKMRFRLRGLNVAEDLIEKSLGQIKLEDEIETAKALAQKWLSKNGESGYNKDKLGRFLAGRGFGYDVISRLFLEIK